MKNNIVLIGMPGVGKSTAGVILAKLIGYQFVDSDLLIQQQEGRLLREIIAQDGVDGFLAVENRVNSELIAESSVIATGGSVIYGKEAMEHLREIGEVVYLSVPYEVLEQRLSDIQGRGVTLREGQTLLDLYKERIPLYEYYADHTIYETDTSTIEHTVSDIVSALKI